MNAASPAAPGSRRGPPLHPTPRLRVLAILATVLALLPGAAHLLELPNKLALPQEQYFVAQQLYRGWAVLGLAWVAALVADVLLAVALRRDGLPWRAALAAAVLMGIVFAIFLGFTRPANVATANWTVAPADWDALRRQWEWSHAANAGLVFLGLCCVLRATVRPR